MRNQQPIKGFSRFRRDEKIKWLSEYMDDDELISFLDQFLMSNPALQEKFESFSENTLSNHHLPWGLVPNVLIDDQLYHVPVVTEESSVVAAASKAASFWAYRGGFKTIYITTIKKGQLHFMYYGKGEMLREKWPQISQRMLEEIQPVTRNMDQRGGGVKRLSLRQIPEFSPNYYQVDMEAETMDSMGANFINSVLEHMGRALPDVLKEYLPAEEMDVIMAILSNHTPESFIEIEVEAPVNQLHWHTDMRPSVFARRMKWAADIAWYDTSRAVTHNKGIFNGVDAVVLATGNDFRAVEAAGHAHACKDGKYRALSRVNVQDDLFSMQLGMPMALGTVGGLTRLHPLAEKTIQILGEPDAKTLMKMAAAVGLANNFAAIASLVTTGIQKGHMKMHLQNILNALDVQPNLRGKIIEHFEDKTVSMSAVRQFVETLT